MRIFFERNGYDEHDYSNIFHNVNYRDNRNGYNKYQRDKKHQNIKCYE